MLAVPRLVAAYYIKSKMKLLMTTNCPRPHILVCLCLSFFLSLSLFSRLSPLAISVPFRCLFVIAWPNALPVLPSVFHLPSATCHLPLAACHLPLATGLLRAVLAHVYSILSLPVPLDLRGMLTAICMESSSCLAWLAASTRPQLCSGEGQL